MKDIDCTGKTSRVINQEIRHHIQAGETDIRVQHPQARHNLGVAVLQPVSLTMTVAASAITVAG